MAKKTYNTPISYTNNIDWEGDNTTGNLPLSGAVVQKWIKDNFNHKAGYFYHDLSSGICYVFANKSDYDTWLTDKDKYDSLVIGQFTAPTEFSMEVIVSEPIKSAAYGSTGNTIDFTWQVKKNDGSILIEDASCVLTFTNGASTKSITFPLASTNTTVSYNVDDYLLSGMNTINVSVTGQTHKVGDSKTIQFDYVNFGITDTYDISKVYDILDSKSCNMTVNYTLIGQGMSYMEWWWDGIKLEHIDNDDKRISSGSTVTSRTFNLSTLRGADTELSLISGVHTLQFRGYVISNGQNFYSDTFYREVILNNSDALLESEVFTVKTTIPKESFKDPKQELRLYGMEQYVPYKLSIATYYPGTSAYIETEVSIDNMETNYNINLSKSSEFNLEIIPSISGDSNINIKSDSVSRKIPVTIQKNRLGLSENTNLLELNFSSDGRTNSSTNKDEWSFGDAKAIFKGFDWTDTSGWTSKGLAISEGASLEITNYLPFETNPYENGKTLEFEFSTNRVINNDTIICSTLDSNGSGILITATEAKLITENKQIVSRQFKSGERVRISFVIEKSSIENPLIILYIDGIISGACPWGKNDSLINTKTISFKGTDDASITLKQIRIYDRDLSSEEILNNFTLYRDTFAEMQTVYNRNNIYEDGLISVNKLAEVIPVMIVTGDIPHVDDQGAGTKADITIMDKVQYIDYINNRSFVFYNAGMSCQGTSSMTYPRKNYRLYTEEKKLSKPTWPNGTTWTYNSEHTGFWRMDSSDINNQNNWYELPWSGKKDGKHKILYSFKGKGDYENGEPVGVSRWTIKADFAESSSTHNTGVARLWNMVMYKAQKGSEYPLRTHAQECALKNGYEYDVRTTVDGFPIVMFYHLKESDDLIFMGKYNFNNDKSNEDVFGFTDIPGFDDDSVPLRAGEEPIKWSYIENTGTDADPVYELKEKVGDKYKKTVQCWELTDSASKVALFMDVPEDELRSMTIADMGYEARYPDDAGETAEYARWWAFVYPFYKWMCDIRNEANITYDSDGRIQSWYNPSRFSEEKYKYMDVYKMAAYYIYLIRFGAVDQVLKNAMLTTEDGRRWYYINYDNDTILGLDNLGNLSYGPTITRNTYVEGGNDYCYAGRNSTLWNCLENDKDFMDKVIEVDNMLRNAGLTYEGILKTFETDGSDKWCETIYNKDAEYKYIESYRKGTNYLGSMQGSRKTHRRWWVSERFDYYDGKFDNNNWYSAGTACLVNCPGVVSGKNYINITAGKHAYYGVYGDGLIYGRAELDADEIYSFPVEVDAQIGRNFVLLGAHNILEINTSIMSKYLKKIQLLGAYDSILGSKLRRLILGSKDGDENSTFDNTSDFKGLSSAENLEEINIEKFTKLTTLDGIETLKYLRKLYASQSGLSGVSFAKGAPIELLELPNTIQTLTLSELPLLKTGGIVFDDGGYNTVTNITIEHCENLKNSWSWINRFKNLKTINLEVEWSGLEWNDLKTFLNNKTGKLKGVISLVQDNLPNNIIYELMDGPYSKWFGKECLNKNNELYVKLPKGIYLQLSKDSIIEGLDTDEGKSQITYYTVGFDSAPQVDIFVENTYSAKVDLSDDLVVAAKEQFDSNTIVNILANASGGIYSTNISILIKNKIYPNLTNSFIEGLTSIYADKDSTYTLNIGDDVRGFPSTYRWYVKDEDGTQFVTINNGTEKTCTIHLGDTETEKFQSIYNITLYLDIDNPYSETDYTYSKPITISQMEGMIISEGSNPELWESIKNGLVPGWDERIANGTVAFTKKDASQVTSMDFSKLGNIVTFDEFKYFTVISSMQKVCFTAGEKLKSVTLPSSIIYEATKPGIPDECFKNCRSLEEVKLDLTNIPESFTIGIDAFSFNISKKDDEEETPKSQLKSLDFVELITYINPRAFYNCSALTDFNLSDKCTGIGSNAFYNCEKLKSINITDNIKFIGTYAFYNCNQLTEIHIPDNPEFTRIYEAAFWFCRNLTNITLPDNVIEIADHAFSSCGIASIDLNKVQTIGDNAFYGCNLTTIELPKTLTSLGKCVFNGNSSLISFTGESQYIPEEYRNSSSTYLITDAKTENNQVTYVLLSVAPGISEFTIPDNIRAIGEECFFVNGSITSITIPTNVKEIQREAFYSCNSLRSVKLHDGITELTNSVFGWCGNLEKITMNDGDINDLYAIKSIKWGAFTNCYSLKNIYFRDLNNIENNVFAGCTKLGEFYMNNATPPTIDNSNTEVFGDESKSLGQSSNLMGKDSDTKILYIPSEAEKAYTSNVRWADLISSSKPWGFTLSATL